MELGALFKSEEWSDTRVPAEQLATIIARLLLKQITGRTAKLLLAMKYDGDARSVEEIIADEDMLLRPLSHQEYIVMAEALLKERPDVVKDIIEKKRHQKVKWFVGQMMSRGAEGTVEPATAEAVLRELLQLPPIEQIQQK
jgi:aspartyl-tRNA(Asn)/glutamyl-tRNA(Gln) amidotransferase subunit B